MTAPLLLTSGSVSMKLCFTAVGQAWWGGEYSWQLYSAASLEHQATGTMTRYYPGTEHWIALSWTWIALSWHWASQSLPKPNNARERQVFDSTRVKNGKVQIRTHDLSIPRSPRTGGGCSTQAATLTGLGIVDGSWGGVPWVTVETSGWEDQMGAR